MWSAAVLLVVILPGRSLVQASIGDSQFSYRKCLSECRDRYDCAPDFSSISWGIQPCFSCKYDCMWLTEEAFRAEHGFTPQFHGKWPFAAIQTSSIAIQEPASVVFSLLNLGTVLLFHYRLGPYSNLPDKYLWRSYCKAGIVTWISSTAFHCVDCWHTERLDYFFACFLIFASFVVAAIFTLPELSSGSYGSFYRSALTFLCAILWVHHVYGLLIHFDYGYNMFVCIMVSIATTALYTRYFLARFRSNQRLTRGDQMLLKAMLLLNGSVLFELFDFAPIWWTIDAHALFHLATVPVPLMIHKALRLYDKERFTA
ncbi:unnamed protein product, partial [Mesorhabditis spiculigera]